MGNILLYDKSSKVSYNALIENNLKIENSTINRILSTVRMFYQYHASMSEVDNPILMKDINRPFNMFKVSYTVLSLIIKQSNLSSR